ncbi:MAG: FHA domain-containing protein [Candidatus Riflebacteria bacterium]|nr:FHA domain-containing protein [Candidatus Riflebacteria bacterium]
MSDEKIVITKRDLSDPKIQNIIVQEKAARKPLSAEQRAPIQTGLILNPIFYTGTAGTIGALAAWALLEPLINKTGGHEDGIGLTLLFPVTAAIIGLFVGLVEGIMSRNFLKAFRCGGIGLGIGLAWGTIILLPANWIYILLCQAGCILFPPPPHKPHQLNDFFPKGGLLFMLMTARTTAWTLIAGGMGLGQGIALASKKLVMNGIAGGLLGGFLGGLLFDPIGLLMHTIQGSSANGEFSRMVGIMVIGMLVGVFLGLVENLSKEAWFIMKSGPLRGKQFVVYTNPMIIGSSPKSDIYIFKDPSVEPKHAEVFQVGTKLEIRDLKSPEGVFVNGSRVERKFLESGDIVVIGESVLEFRQKEVG